MSAIDAEPGSIYSIRVRKSATTEAPPSEVEVEFSNPCAALQHLKEALQTDPGVVERNESVLLRYQAECDALVRRFGGIPSPKLQPKNVKSDLWQALGSPSYDGPPLSGTDSASEQGAQPVDPNNAVLVRPNPARTILAAPARESYDQQAPIPPERVPSQMASPPSSPSDWKNLQQLAAQGRPEKGAEDPFRSGQRARSRQWKGDPVDLHSGRLTVQVLDLHVPTPLLPIDFIRTYESTHPYVGPWGYNWDHNFNLYLRELADGGIAQWTGALHENRFRSVGDAFEPDYGIHDRLERVEGSSDSYLLVQTGGTRLRFARPEDWTDATRIPLVEIRDRYGNTITCDYDANNALLSVLDEGSRGLRFRYGNCGLLERVEDHSGERFVIYEHDADAEHLVAATTAPTSVYPHGATTRYEWDITPAHPAMRHNILSVIDADGRIEVENEYGDPGLDWGFNRVTRQVIGGHLYEFEYEQLQYVPEDPTYVDVFARRTLVRPPDGSLHTYTFNYRGDLLEHRYRLRLDGTYRVVVWEWAYDDAGNVSVEVRPDGVQVLLTHDSDNPDPCARGNLLQLDLSASTPATSRTVLEAKYEPQFQLLTWLKDEAGSETRLVYDLDAPGTSGATGRLRSVKMPTVQLPDNTEQLASMGVETNDRGQILAVVSPLGVRTEFEYEPFGSEGIPALGGFLKRRIENAGAVARIIEFEYDQYGYRRETAVSGVATQLHHNRLGQIEEMVLPVVDGDAARILYRYSAADGLLQVDRPRGDYSDGVITDQWIRDEYELGSSGRPVKATIGVNTLQPRVRTICRDFEGRAIQEIDPTGMISRVMYDERGLPLRETLVSVTTAELRIAYSWDRTGHFRRMESATATLLNVADRDPWGRLRKLQLHSGAEVELDWGKGDRLTELRVVGDPGDGTSPRLLLRRSFSYDARGRATTLVDWSFNDDPSTAIPLSTHIVRDADDRVREIRNPRGASVRYDYDGLGRLVRREDAYGNVQTNTYDDALGRVETITLTEGPPSTRVIRWVHTYDDRGRLQAVIVPSGVRTECSYDARDLPNERREPLDTTTRFHYGLLGELQQQTEAEADLALTTRVSHDAVGRVAAYTDGTGESTGFGYDGLGRLVSLRLPDGTEWRRIFETAANRIVTLAPSGTRINLDVDASGGHTLRLASNAGAGIVDVAEHTFAYDSLMRLVRASVADNVVTRRYDSLGRIVEERSNGHAIRLRYHDLDGTIDLVFPDGRVERTFTDAGGRPTSVRLVQPGALGGSAHSELARLSFAGENRLERVDLGNGTTTSCVYDDALRLVRIDHSTATSVESCRYRYDARDRTRVVQLHGPSGLNRLHMFDSADRLVEVRSGFPLAVLNDPKSQSDHDLDIAAAEAQSAGAASREEYQLDAADSRLQVRLFEATTSQIDYAYDPGHRLRAAAAQSLIHHLDGVRTRDGSRTYESDALGRIVRIRESAGGIIIAELGFDALGRPIATSTKDGELHRWFAGERCIHEELAGQIVRQITPHPIWPAPLMVWTPADQIVPHHDAAFSSICFTDAAAHVRARARFSPFGSLSLLQPDGGALPIGSVPGIEPMFGGMSYLPAADLYATLYRLYDARHGVFLARDPLLYRDSASPYLYVRHNPVDFIDPVGLGKQQPPSFPQIDHSLRFGPGLLSKMYDDNQRQVHDRSLPWRRRLWHASRTYNLWQGVQWEAAARSVLNIPDAAVAAGQHWARAVDRVRQAQTHVDVLESYVDYLEGVEQMADAFGTALGAVTGVSGIVRSAGGVSWSKIGGSIQGDAVRLLKDTRGSLNLGKLFASSAEETASAAALRREGLVLKEGVGGYVDSPIARTPHGQPSAGPDMDRLHIAGPGLGFDIKLTIPGSSRLNRSQMASWEYWFRKAFREGKGGRYEAELWGPPSGPPTHIVMRWAPSELRSGWAVDLRAEAAQKPPQLASKLDRCVQWLLTGRGKNPF